MPRPRTIRVCILIGVGLGLIVGIWTFLRRPSERESDSPEATSMAAAPRKTGANEDRESARLPATPKAGIYARIRSSLEAFRSNRDDGLAVVKLRELRDAIRQAPEDEAAAAVIAFLKTSDDAPTGLPFVVGPDGMMEVVPSVRLALLDLLPSLDPVAALELARELMDQRTSADEYALALRNMAWNDLDGDLRDELSGRFMELLKSPWLDQPSAGFLEAFDIAVEVGGSPMFDRMVSLAGEAMAKSNLAASRAAFMSLDRMVVRDHALLTTAFSSKPGWMDFAPQQRASLMSRLDISEPGQRDVFSRYLSATPHAAGELEYFAKIFPNENFLHGHRLVTADDATPDIDQVTAADARVLGELDALEAALPDAAKAAVRTIRERLKRPAK
jgi:hypothetical protein